MDALLSMPGLSLYSIPAAWLSQFIPFEQRVRPDLLAPFVINGRA